MSTNEGWYSMTKRDDYLPKLTLEIGKEYELTLESVGVVRTKYGILAARLIVEYENKRWCHFPHADLKRKLLELQRQRGATLKNVRVKVVQVRKQSASGKKIVYIYELTPME